MGPDEAITKYQTFDSNKISVATVADFCDSIDHLAQFAMAAGDLKDVQRTYVIKAIIGSIRPGGKLLEIGAGEPVMADFLSRCGYNVTIVDPYDGSGHGPTDFEAYKSQYSTLKFIRKNFGDDLAELEASSFDGIYSISVLEHVPFDAVASVCRGIRKFIRKDGKTLHAIDHVLIGNGDLYHLEKLIEYSRQLGLSAGALVKAIEDSELDPETYFLSAEGHNRWRNGVTYSEFPMRKVISVQISTLLE